MNSLESLYLHWLCKKVCNGSEINRYSKLFEYLYVTEFEWRRELDENSYEHGQDLKDEFFRTSSRARNMSDYYDLQDFCSVLEMMVALTERMEAVMANDYYGDRREQWFWSMIEGIGLDEFDDYHWNRHVVNVKIRDFLNGNLSLFGSKTSVKNANLWQQANEFMCEIAKNDGEI